MKVLRNILILILLTTLAAPAVLASSAFTLAAGRGEPSRLRWKTRTVRIAVSDSLTLPGVNIKTDSDVLGAFRRNLEMWLYQIPNVAPVANLSTGDELPITNLAGGTAAPGG